MKPRHCGSISMIVAGSGATRTVRGTTVPTLMSKFTLLTRGADEVSTVVRILVFCSAVSVTLPPPLVVDCAVPWRVVAPVGACEVVDDEPVPLLFSCDCCVVDGVVPLFCCVC